jgi:hypothetical protein
LPRYQVLFHLFLVVNCQDFGIHGQELAQKFGYIQPIPFKKQSKRGQQMENDRIHDLINEAHTIFNKTSIFEVIDLVNEQAAKDFLKKEYDNPDDNSIAQYLSIVNEINTI